MAQHPPDLPDRIGGNLALDFANTISWRGTDRAFDHLAGPAGLQRWASAVRMPIGSVSVAELAQAHALRSAIQTIGEAVAEGGDPPPAALAVVQRRAGAALGQARLHGTPLQVDFEGKAAVLDAVAWALLDLLRSPEVARLRYCPAADCHWLFVDRTRNGSRRWCDMDSCGDREKKRRRAR